MFTVTTTVTSSPSGRAQVVAKGHGKQRTVPKDFSKSDEANDGAAAGTLLNVLLDNRQQSMVRHPSGAQRVTRECISDGGGKHRWTVNV
jgi:hypothetical protein